jgi:hypothetical protein
MRKGGASARMAKGERMAWAEPHEDHRRAGQTPVNRLKSAMRPERQHAYCNVTEQYGNVSG